MARRRRETELSLERPVRPGATETVRLSVRFPSEPGDAGPDARELAEALEGIRAELDGLVGSAEGTPREDRTLEELIETYRPRQPELIELLREEGELSPGEYALLRAHGVPEPMRSAPSAPPAAAPRGSEATPVGPASPRAVAALIDEYHIESLRQAGAVRARRQISFEEYMALKRHFERPPVPAAPPSAPPPE